MCITVVATDIIGTNLRIHACLSTFGGAPECIPRL